VGSVSVDMKENVSATVTFMSDDSIAFGGGSGLVYVAEGTPLTVKHTLKHGGAYFLPSVSSGLICDEVEGDIIQALVRSLTFHLQSLIHGPRLLVRLVGVNGL